MSKPLAVIFEDALEDHNHKVMDAGYTVEQTEQERIEEEAEMQELLDEYRGEQTAEQKVCQACGMTTGNFCDCI